MNMPGFTAEALLYKENESYRMTVTLESAEASAPLRLQRWEIGLPSQAPYSVCWHVCMTLTGGSPGGFENPFFQRCMFRCISSVPDWFMI
jgi:hypothetical protein